MFLRWLQFFVWNWFFSCNQKNQICDKWLQCLAKFMSAKYCSKREIKHFQFFESAESCLETIKLYFTASNYKTQVENNLRPSASQFWAIFANIGIINVMVSIGQNATDCRCLLATRSRFERDGSTNTFSNVTRCWNKVTQKVATAVFTWK